MPRFIDIKDKKEHELIKGLEKRTDADALRIKRFLEMPDLSRTEGSPLKEVVDRTLKVDVIKDLDVIKIPEIISTEILFDLFNMPPGHPARSKSDTYYVDDTHILRTHDTVFWYYYLNDPEVKERIAKKQPIGAMCFGKVYRKDEIDRTHMNVFHQIGGLYLVPDDSKDKLGPDDLKNVLSSVAKSVFGEEVNYRFYDHTFPYTDPSFEMEAEIKGKWVEMLGSGMARKSVLKNMGLEGYHGWAFGFGMERLAMMSMELPDIRLLWSEDPRVKRQLKLNQKYEDVSKYPPIVRDISFIIDKSVAVNDYFDTVRDIAGNLIEEMKQIDSYENEKKFGAGKISYTFRITYRSTERTLTNEEVNSMHEKIREQTAKQYGATLR
jgi:phenylalanyl-tRNA synthetase alpha chain